ncbi:hypothetical protein BDF14DRAFT_1401764 [Spinellus fusiger]|nr:hypothetical protein BDF14DRAFT_1401764 [Spinellus fusiger]
MNSKACEAPYRTLHTVLQQMYEQLQATDTRALNRHLNRAFDMAYLTSMSNNLLQTLLMDIGQLHEQFATETASHASDFHSLLSLAQDMLREIAKLRSTMNDLQVDYVKKVQESDQRTKEEVHRRTHPSSSHQHHHSHGASPVLSPNPLSWLTSVFKSSSHSKSQEKTQQSTGAVGSLDASPGTDTAYTPFPPTSVPRSHRPPSASAEEHRRPPAQILRHKKSDLDRHGPAASFPRPSPEKRRLFTLPPKPKPIPYVSRGSLHAYSSPSNASPSQGGSGSLAGSVGASKRSQSIATDHGVHRKRSGLGLNRAQGEDPFDLASSPVSPNPQPDWNGSTVFGTSWLANK